MADQDSILLVLPLGMSLRNIVLNRRIWEYLTGTYHVDVVSSIEIEKHEALGIRKIYDAKRISVFRRGLRALSRAIAVRIRFIDLLHFSLKAGGPDVLANRYQQFERSGQLPSVLRWASLRNKPIASLLRRLSLSLLRFYPLHPFNSRAYRFVVLGHSSEEECLVYGLLANQRRVPVVCAVMGMDNLIHAPFIFKPDLLLLWGEDQSRSHLRYQVPLNPALSSTACAVVGDTSDDAYRESPTDGSAFRQQYDLAEDDQVILFPAFPESDLSFGDPGRVVQPAICQIILRFLRSHDLKIKLLVRTRPGIDEAIWEQFYAENQDLVRLQMPKSSSYDKSGNIPIFEENAERRDVELFAETVRHSALVVSPTPSTVGIDAMALGRPAFNLLFDPTATAFHRSTPRFYGMIARNPAWLTMKTATTEEQAETLLRQVFIEGRADEFVATELTEDLKVQGETSAGERWIKAVDEFSASLGD